MSQITFAIVLSALLSSVTCAPAQDERMEAFEVVCQTIEENFYDPEFGGVDWTAIAKTFRPRVAAVVGDEEFYVMMNEMLFELGVSHVGLIPDEHPEWIGAPAVFADGHVGVDVRLIGEDAVVVKVSANSPGHAAGIRPGARLLRIDGKSFEEVMTKALKAPIAPLDLTLLKTQALQQGLFGPSGGQTTMEFANFGEESAVVTLQHTTRPGRSILIEGIPPSYLEFEARRIEGSIGYLRFNAFDPALLDQILAAVDSFQDTDGLVIDLRGNPGGAFVVRRALAERLVTEECTIWTQNGRRGAFEVNLIPRAEPYLGEVLILIDLMSCSSAEELAGGLQTLGRAVIVGEKTTGVVLVAEVKRLDIGATLVYPEAETQLADGSTLEGIGVTPDLAIRLDRQSLSEGRDVQLEAAIQIIRDRTDR